MTESKKIAIAMATYNPNEFFFKEQIKSLKEQTYRNWVCFISDDNSDSKSISMIKETIDMDRRFILITNTGPKNAYHNFENTLKNISSDFDLVAFCDQDDVWKLNKLEKLSEHFTNSQIQVVHSDLVLIDKFGAVIAESCWKSEGRNVSSDVGFYDFFLKNNVTGCSMMFRQELLNLALPFPIQDKIGFYHDHWIALVGKAKGEIFAIEEPFIYYRQHEANVVGASQKNKKQFCKKIKDFHFIMEKSKWAYLQRDMLYKNLVERFPNVREQLSKWDDGLIPFLYDMVKMILKNSTVSRLCIQLIIGRMIYKKNK